MFGFIKKMFIGLLTTARHTNTYVSLKNKKCMTQATIINLHFNEYTQGLC